MEYKILLVLILSLTLTSASTITCTIIGDKTLVEMTLTEDTELMLPEEYSLLEQNGDKVSFITKDYIRKNSEYIFVLPKIMPSTYDLKVYLPQNHILSDNLVYPKNYEISSDGKSIILDWKNVTDETIVFYKGVSNPYILSLIIILILIAIAAPALWILQKKKFKKELERLKREEKKKNIVSKKENLTKNLFGDEKRIVKFLIKNKNCWTKELSRELKIPKVRLSRKIRSLTEKGIVAKENFGRENKIRLK